jgi:hypothetical protein
MVAKFLAAGLLLAPMVMVAQKQKSDPWAGTWKINLAKSTFPGPPPQTEVLTIQPNGTISLHEVSQKGVASDWTYKPVEGKPVQVMGRKGTVMVTVHHAMDAHRRDHDWDNNGKPSKSYTTVSDDGKTQTYHALGADGKPTEIVAYEKQ